MLDRRKIMRHLRDMWRILPAMALLAFNLCAAETPSATNQSRIACSAPVYDFGRMGNTALVTHVYLIANEGTAPLVPGRVDTGCGCTLAKFSTNAIPPGGTAELTVRFDTANRTGPQRKAIYVKSNDRQTPILRLELTGDLFDVSKFLRPPAPVIPVTVTAGPGTVTITPDRVDFGGVRPEDRPEGQVIVSGEGTNDFRVLGAASSCTNLAFRIEPLDGRRWRVTVSLLPSRPAGKGNADISIRTTHPAMGETRIAATWEALSDIYSTPCEVSLAVSPGQSKTVCRYVAVRSHSDKPFKIERIDLPDSGMETRYVAVPGGYRCEIQNIRPSTNLDGRAIIVITDRVNEHSVSIPIHVVARETHAGVAGR